MVEPAGSPPRRRGRPRADGSRSQRPAIVRAARAEFAAHGYDGTSLRAVARRAEVDPALVHHYFADKTDLFAATIDLPVRPDLALDTILAGPRDQLGAGILRFLLTAVEDEGHRDRMVALLRAVVANRPVGILAKAFISTEVVGRLAAVAAGPDPRLRANLVASQVAGLLIARYVIGLEPLASTPVEQVVAEIGPTLQRYLLGADPG